MIDSDQDTEMKLATMIANTSMAFIVSNPRLHDNPIVMCNNAFMEISGYAKDEIIGRNCRFLTGKGTEPAKTQLIVNAILTYEPIHVQITNYKRDGSSFQNAVMIAPTFDQTGQLAYFLGSQVEISGDPNQAAFASDMLAKKKIELLTPQQKRVLTQVSRGHMNKQIAHILRISVSTVKMHRAEALIKMNVSTTAEAIRLAVLAGL